MDTNGQKVSAPGYGELVRVDGHGQCMRVQCVASECGVVSGVDGCGQ